MYATSMPIGFFGGGFIMELTKKQTLETKESSERKGE